LLARLGIGRGSSSQSLKAGGNTGVADKEAAGQLTFDVPERECHERALFYGSNTLNANRRWAKPLASLFINEPPVCTPRCFRPISKVRSNAERTDTA
jgi:hypothetical protein